MPLSSSSTINFPCRFTDLTCWLRTRRASSENFWRTTWCEKKRPLTMRRPVSLGARDRTTVSTSGSSGTGLRIQQDVIAFCFDQETIQLDSGVVVVFAGPAIVRPLVPGAHDQVVLQGALANGSAGVRTNPGQRVQFTSRVAD